MKMVILKAISFLLLLCSVANGAPRSDPPPNPPIYSSPYRISGVIRLPYAEITEPFLAFYDAKNNRSRVDYYDGIQITIQKSFATDLPYGVSYKIVPFTNQTVINVKTCFQANGGKGNTVDLTQVLPDLTNFKFVSIQPCQKDYCNVFQEVVTVGKKTSTYTFLARRSDNVPVRYEMMGYDSLLGSHFDKYYVDYNLYEPNAKFTDADFQPQGLTCTGFPGPGMSKEEEIQMSPIREYVSRDDEHVSEAFEKFKKEHNKHYSDKEHNERHHIFRQNLRYIHSINRAGKTYTVAVNHLADLAPKEMKKLRGFRYTHVQNRGDQKFSWKNIKTTEVPDQWDWRLKGAVTPVKDQAICGSCWSFGTTGTIEGANFLKTGNLVRLSQSELVDCSWGYGNNGCDGGEDFRAYKFIMDNGGLTSEEQYGPYLGIDSYCKKQLTKPVVKISNFTTIPQGNLSALKVAIFNKGPISVGIDASHKSLGFYANGIYYEPDCRNDPDGLDHAVLAVGYGVLDGQAYWLVKNSWSTYWGNDGYVLMSQKDNNCGVATDATYVDIA